MYRVFSNRLASAQNLQLIGAHLRLMSSCQKNLVDRIIRVDHAGELGADRIYAGQYAVLKKTPVGSLIKEMWEEEKYHRETFEKLMVQHRARPTALLPIWNVAGFVLGAGTALMGKEAAMACTVAVEDVIGHHYNAS
ncbi:5-demethoxyubiquinone hydroxylase, mitochondrial-like [Octopus vulgaris]|uniref:5-demethoxyubiquinone hydroxylase, mitochondrial-like n=1 Tax=Octopus vulgaris TaxID=6645 RepID=A0AA36FDF7_OCTVU|nr:5-demethoxyubiquinone hydroxylase, mitochondrial-like [Octopus vulgaris]